FLCNADSTLQCNASVGSAAPLLGRFFFRLPVGWAGLVMNELPDGTLPHKQVRGDEEAAGNRLEADDHRAIAEHGGASGAAGDVWRLRIAENALPAAHHRRPPVNRSPARMDAGDWTMPRPDLLHGRKVARREGPVEGLVREQDGIMIH